MERLEIKEIIALSVLVLSLISFTFGNNYHGCALAPNSNHGWVVTIESTLCYHTWDGGVHWEQQNIPTTRDFFDIFFLDSLRGWTANRLAMIWHTDDGGASWRWQNLGGAKFATRIFFLDYTFGWAACGEAIVLLTTDSGTSWVQIDLHNYLPADTVDFYDVSFVNELKGWMVAGRYPELDTAGNVIFKQGQGYIVHSEDGGDSWVLQRRDTYYDFFGVKFKDELEGWVVGGNDSTMEACVLHTTDGGQTWQAQSIPAQAKYLRALELIDGNKLWAVGRNGTIIYSSNGGNTWTLQTSGVDTTLFDVDFADSLRGLIAGNDIVLYTQDGGRNWIITDPTGLFEPKSRISNFEFRISNLICYPNPFTAKTTIRFNGNPKGFSVLKIYNSAGELVKSFSLTTKNQQPITLIWDGRDDRGKELAPGIYFCQLQASRIGPSPESGSGGYQQLRKITLIK
ncbi:MAG: YCF48-related protein [candidate division WOR-3 bacterium]